MALASDSSLAVPQLLPMRAEHLEAVHAIEKISQSHPWSVRMFADCLEVGYSAWVLCAEDGSVVAFSVHSMALDEAHLLNLAVAPSARRQGLARSLLDRVVAQAQAARARTLFLEVRASNEAALELYATIGFALLARRKGYYPSDDGREDALLLQLPL